MSTPDGPYDLRYLRGIERFNRGEYFECHEVWEDLWREAGDPAKTFLKGLIQAAVALHHQRRGNRHGAAKLLASSRACLEGYRCGYLGLDVNNLLGQIAGCWQGLAGNGAAAGRVSDDADPLSHSGFAGPRPLIVLEKRD